MSQLSLDAQVVVVDPCWDVNGILKLVRQQRLKIVGAVATHYQ